MFDWLTVGQVCWAIFTVVPGTLLLALLITLSAVGLGIGLTLIQSFRVPVYTPVEDGIRVECPANGNNWKTAAVESPLPQDMKQLFGEK